MRTSQNTRRKRRTNAGNFVGRRALTLVETVAVVASLCAILTVIVPALGETRRRGKDTVCIQNLHRIIEASHVYAGHDSSEMLIPAGAPEWNNPQLERTSGYTRMAAYGYGGKSGRAYHLQNPSVAQAIFGPAFKMNAFNRPLNQVLYRDAMRQLAARAGQNGAAWEPDASLPLDVYRCPADGGYAGLDEDLIWRSGSRSAYDYYGTSYAANIMWIDYIDAPGVLRSNSPYLRPLSRVPNPVRTVAYLENCGRYAWRAEPDQCPPAVGLLGTAHGWHGVDWTFNTAFVDGRVESTRMRGHRVESLSHSPFPPQVTPCIMARGEGWQLDTLPSAPVMTTHLSNELRNFRAP